jgi:superfamily II DNA or RNA helicase
MTQAIELYDYQQSIKNSVMNELQRKTQAEIPVLAMATGTGKTRTAVSMINELEGNILVLTHGQNTLKTNFGKELLQHNIPFGDAANYKQNRIVVDLPVNCKTIKNHFSYIFVDEAHERVTGNEHKVIKLNNPKAKWVYLTASHGMLKGSFSKHYVSMVEAYLKGCVSDYAMVGVQTKWRITDDDYSGNELKEGVSLKKMDIVNSIKDLVLEMSKHHQPKTMFGKLAGAFSVGAAKVITGVDVSRFPKTIIACNNNKTADRVYKAFKERFKEGFVGVDTTDHNNIETVKLTDWDSSKTCRVMVICQKGRIGYDSPNTECFVDMSGTKDLSVIMQMVGRVSRKSPAGAKKVYYKVMTAEYESLVRLLLQAVTKISTPGGYRDWDGTAKIGNMSVSIIKRSPTVWAEKIKEFYQVRGRLPAADGSGSADSKDGDDYYERQLANWLSALTEKGSSRKNEELTQWAKSVGYKWQPRVCKNPSPIIIPIPKSLRDLAEGVEAVMRELAHQYGEAFSAFTSVSIADAVRLSAGDGDDVSHLNTTEDFIEYFKSNGWIAR